MTRSRSRFNRSRQGYAQIKPNVINNMATALTLRFASMEFRRAQHAVANGREPRFPVVGQMLRRTGRRADDHWNTQTRSTLSFNARATRIFTSIGRRRDFDFRLFRVMHGWRGNGHRTRRGVQRLIVRRNVIAVRGNQRRLRLLALVVIVITVARIVRPVGDGYVWK